MLCFFHQKKNYDGEGIFIIFLVQITKRWQSTLNISKAAHPPDGPQKGGQMELREPVGFSLDEGKGW